MTSSNWKYQSFRIEPMHQKPRFPNYPWQFVQLEMTMSNPTMLYQDDKEVGTYWFPFPLARFVQDPSIERRLAREIISNKLGGKWWWWVWGMDYRFIKEFEHSLLLFIGIQSFLFAALQYIINRCMWYLLVNHLHPLKMNKEEGSLPLTLFDGDDGSSVHRWFCRAADISSFLLHETSF